MNCHIVIGDPNTRKSALIRCLTGVVGGGNANQLMDIAINGGGAIKAHCMTSSLIELKPPLSPSDFQEFVESLDSSVSDIVFALRVKGVGKGGGRFTAEDYLDHFSKISWTISSVALLGNIDPATESKLTGLTPSAKIVKQVSSATQPTNQTAACVRNVWGWL